VAALLATVDFGDLWDAATPPELRTLTNELIDSVNFYPDGLTVQVVSAPPIRVAFDEKGLRSGSKPVVSEARRDRNATLHWLRGPRNLEQYRIHKIKYWTTVDGGPIDRERTHHLGNRRVRLEV
jgi:hypothetical protein